MSSEVEFEINNYPFDANLINLLGGVSYAGDLWPVVYLLNSRHGKKPSAYVGETADAPSRLSSHLIHPQKRTLTDAYLITSGKFNKSATLDLEANLIKYLSADGQYQLLNANLGLVDHNYYQKDDVYRAIFRSVWNGLRARGVARHSIDQIDNSDLFKYSPYKSLTADQTSGLIRIMEALLNDAHRNVVIEGIAGTGKSILAVFLFKLLHTPIEEFYFGDFGAAEQQVIQLVRQIREKYPDLKMALVIPMESFRKTVQKIFKHVSGLRANMVIGPADVAKKRYDILLVDESHRLKRRLGLSQYGSFDQASTALGFDKYTHSELDWVLKQSDKAIFFYDEFQRIKPADIPKEAFDRLKNQPETRVEYLTSQMRVRGGNHYTHFLDQLLQGGMPAGQRKFTSKDYELQLFTDAAQLIDHIKQQDRKHQLARTVAGYAWPWASKNNPAVYDITIDSLQLKWNSVSVDWPNSPNAINEVGCIHTIQGYDLNYTGVIFGPEIGYDRETQQIIIHREHYHDRNGKVSVKSAEQLKTYILHIYKTLMLRGIKGTYVYVCDKALREYFAQHIPLFDTPDSITSQKGEDKKDTPIVPFENSVPLYQLTAAAGDFSEQQQAGDREWVRVPEHVRISKDHFACRVVGESMNKVIPSGAVCLFKKYMGGSRNGLIVLAQHTDRQDADFGSHYTVKEYRSTKQHHEGSWSHQAITLLPLSDDPSYQPLHLQDDELSSFSVVGVFEQVL